MNIPFLSREQSWQSQYGDYYGSAQKKPMKKLLLIGGAIAVVVIIIVVVVVTTSNNVPGDEAEDDIIADLVDPNEVDESLNDRLKELAKDSPYKNYESSFDATKYSDISEDFLPTNLEDGVDDEILVYSAAFSILSEKYVSAVTFQEQTPEEKAVDLGIKIEKVKALSSNILNYYLDDNSVVIIKAKGDEPFSEKGKLVLVYAGRPALGVYEYYASDQKCAGCSVPFVINKLDLFSAMKGDEEFYVLSKEVE